MPRSRRREYDDDDDLPRRKKSRRRDYDDDDDDDDEDDRPRKRLKQGKKKSGGANPMLIVLGIVGGLVVLVGALAAVVALGGGLGGLGGLGDTPQAGFEDYQNSLNSKNYGRAYDRLDPELQQQTSAMMEIFKSDPRIARGNKSGRDLFVAVCEESDKNGSRNDGTEIHVRLAWRNGKVQSVTETGDTATVTVNVFANFTQTCYMRRINGMWRISPSPTPGFGR